MPDFSGVVAAVDVGYVMREVTRIGVVDRNLDYSFQADKPYYVATAVMFDVKQALGFSWDVVGRVGRARLAYQGFIGDDAELQRAQRDHLTTHAASASAAGSATTSGSASTSITAVVSLTRRSADTKASRREGRSYGY